MSTWPAYAQIDPERRILPVSVVERTEFDDGSVRQARRFTAAPACALLDSHISSDPISELD